MKRGRPGALSWEGRRPPPRMAAPHALLLAGSDRRHKGRHEQATPRRSTSPFDHFDNSALASTSRGPSRPRASTKPRSGGSRAFSRCAPPDGSHRSGGRPLMSAGSDLIASDCRPPEPGGLPEKTLARHLRRISRHRPPANPKVTRTAYQRALRHDPPRMAPRRS